MGEQQRVPAVGGAAHKHAAHPVAPATPRVEHLHGVQLALGVLPVRPLGEVQAGGPLRVGVHRVGGLWGQEGQLGGDAAGARRAAEEPAKLAKRKHIHPGALLGHRGSGGPETPG